jgi:hypothetical protein
MDLGVFAKFEKEEFVRSERKKSEIRAAVIWQQE